MINFPDPNAVVTNWLQYAKFGTCGCTASRCCPDRDVCVDEQLVPFKGRCGFRQYMPKKPAKYGLKVWALCDVKMSYAWKVQVYTGKAAGKQAEVNQGMRVVLEMTDGLQGPIFAFTKMHTLVSYVPRHKTNILLLGTKHQTSSITDDAKRKPKMITEYNKCKGGVNNLDKVGVITHQLRTHFLILAHLFLCKIYIGLMYLGFFYFLFLC